MEYGERLELSEVLQENGGIHRWVGAVLDENNKWGNGMAHHTYRTTCGM
jgi:hypothetical protein